MAKLLNNISRKVQASTLVEVLIAMAILLATFAVGMLVFARLTSSSLSSSRAKTALQLLQLADDYSNGSWDGRSPIDEDQYSYSLQEEPMPAYPDRKRIKIYSFDKARNHLCDSLILLIDHEEQ